MAVKCILTGQIPSVLDGVTGNIQTQLNSKQDKIIATGFLVGSADGTVTGVEDTFVGYDSLSDVEAASSPNDWHIGDNGNWYFGTMDSGKSSKGADGTDGKDGTNGSDGYSPTFLVGKAQDPTYQNNYTYTLILTKKDGATEDLFTIQDGIPGKSAYASAQSGGYTGTESAFNTALAQVDAKQDKITTSGILKGDGSGGVSKAVKGYDYAEPSHGVGATPLERG